MGQAFNPSYNPLSRWPQSNSLIHRVSESLILLDETLNSFRAICSPRGYTEADNLLPINGKKAAPGSTQEGEHMVFILWVLLIPLNRMSSGSDNCSENDVHFERLISF